MDRVAIKIGVNAYLSRDPVDDYWSGALLYEGQPLEVDQFGDPTNFLSKSTTFSYSWNWLQQFPALAPSAVPDELNWTSLGFYTEKGSLETSTIWYRFDIEDVVEYSDQLSLEFPIDSFDYTFVTRHNLYDIWTERSGTVTFPDYFWYITDGRPTSDCSELKADLDQLQKKIKGHQSEYQAALGEENKLHTTIEIMRTTQKSAAETADLTYKLLVLETITFGLSNFHPALKGYAGLAPTMTVAAIDDAADLKLRDKTADAQEAWLITTSEYLENVGKEKPVEGLDKLGKSLSFISNALALKEFKTKVDLRFDELGIAVGKFGEIQKTYPDMRRKYDEVVDQINDIRQEWKVDYGKWMDLKDRAEECPTDPEPAEKHPEKVEARQHDEIEVPRNLDKLASLEVEQTFDQIYNPPPKRQNINTSDKNDIALGNDVDNGMTLGAGSDIATGGNGNDRVKGNAGDDLIFGDVGNDRLSGGVGHDVLVGGKGHDRLSGGSGRDWLVGGIGCDVLEGGPGADVFIIAKPAGNRCKTKIRDFEPGEDQMDLRDFRFERFSEVSKALDDSGDDTTFSYKGREILVVLDVASSELVSDDFLL